MEEGRHWGVFALGLALVGCVEGSSADLDADDGADGQPPARVDDSGAMPPDGSDDGDDDDAEPPAPHDEAEPLTVEQVRWYLRKLAPILVGRSLTYDENVVIETLGEDAIAHLLPIWVDELGFAAAARDIVSTQLAVSGERDDIDFDLPGNLAAQIARDGLPWSTILTADYCVDENSAMVTCDTGAPYEAGVLATRAYLISNNGRFNLGRAKRMLEVFACRGYPMEPDIQVPLEKELLIPMFQAQTPEEQTVEEAQGGFGNGSGCYLCHSQFGAHAQLFVRFDEEGLWQANATGLQAPDLQLGYSQDGLFTSHFEAPSDAANERSWVFGEEVANLREAAEVMSDHPLFFECTANNLISHAFELADGEESIESGLLVELGEQILATSDDPTLEDIVLTVFQHEEVVRAAVPE